MPRGKSDPPETQGDNSHLGTDPQLSGAPRRTTRTSQMTKEALVNLPSEVKNVTSAYKFLRNNGFITETSEISLPQLALVLLQITQWAKIPTTGTNAIRSVAFILETVEANVLVDSITNNITAALTPHFAQLQENVQKAQTTPAPAQTQSATTTDDLDYICATLEELSHKVNDSNESLTTIHETLANANVTIDAVANKLDEALPPKSLIDLPHANNPILDTVKASLEEIKDRLPPTRLLPSQPAQQHPRPSTYAAAVANNTLTRIQKEIIARSEAKCRQVAIKCSAENIKSLSEKELMEKASLALRPTNNQHDRPDLACRNVRKTRGDIIILEMNSKEGAKWLSSHKNKIDFINRFNSDTQILEPIYKTKVEFIPITLNADNPLSLRDIEIATDLPANSISKISWLRRPSERKPHQKVAHAFITFNSSEVANQAIRNGLSIEGKKVSVQRTYPEPMRCFRCQCLQKHLIANCPKEEDTCGTCGKHDHRTPQCEEKSADNFYCVNCRIIGHASWDHSCPTFAQEKEKLNAQNIEHGCKYFPVDNDPSMWPDCNAHTHAPQTNTSYNSTRDQPSQPRTDPPNLWTTTTRQRPPNNPTTQKTNGRDKAHNQVRLQQPSQLTTVPGTQSNLDNFLSRGRDPQRQHQRPSTPNKPPDLPPLSPPSNNSPS